MAYGVCLLPSHSLPPETVKGADLGVMRAGEMSLPLAAALGGGDPATPLGSTAGLALMVEAQVSQR